MRLCIDARMIHLSGIGTTLQHLIPLLDNRSHEIILLGEKPIAQCMSIRFTLPIYSVREQIYYPWKIPDCDVFWSPHYNAPLLPIRAKKRIATIHDICHLAFPLSPFKRSISRLLLQNACRKSDEIVTVSAFSQSEIETHLHVKPKKVHVIYPGVDLQKFSPKNKIEQAPFFLFVGNIKAHKNLTVLLNAFNRLHLKDHRLIIAGKKGGLRSFDREIEKQIEQSPLKKQIELLGEVSDSQLQTLYASASALIFPSLYEGFGLPPLEAMASGCPVIASNAASIPEVCQDAALYFPPRSPEDLAEKMQQALFDSSLRSKLIQKGFVRSALFSWENTAQKYKTLFFGSEPF
ncbi:MAG TPA: glycosyltransferase family 1 protein [Parachlamydiales bacterium]|nr:glycosyltransferase family 1 protein [Parachlamydiales bacterium]